jgi:hypothetical protein
VSDEPEAMLEVLDAGRAPRRSLRYRLTPGTSHRSIARLWSSLTTTVASNAVPLEQLPPLEVERRFDVGRVRPEHGTELRVAVTAVRPIATDGAEPPPLEEPLREAFAVMTRHTGTVVLSDRGVARDAVVPLPEAKTPLGVSMVQSYAAELMNPALLLPVEPVGAGARWTVTRQTITNGAATRVVETNSLVAVNGDRLTLRSTSVFTIDDQTVAVRGAEPGQRRELRSTGGHGTSEMVVDLTRVGAVTARGELVVTGSTLESAGGERVPVTFELRSRSEQRGL